ncbi:PhzF family phenazine biosynthesis isomerase [Sphaerochaeta sp. UBA5856]|jgi:PhzF family phenazine biosynthesis protein|uniref:PhzF family phenazine biosynthesis isomerase n=1 Tax=Sphaerochaeta sp. UBA5856 TaxID=1947476 RepID=UPI002600C794|nr:PhzF family phenazine biosynthesis isomerase [Sphaerochaeta sp. UBA5856]
MQERTVWQVDAFTTIAFTGNPAGVVYPCDGLTEDEMLKISRELNNSETAFIQKLDRTDTQHIRFFTPKQEVPLCTHAAVASYHILATRLGLKAGEHHLHCKAGLLPVGVEQSASHPNIRVTQKEGHFGPLLSESQNRKLREALQLDASSFYEELPVQIVSTGNAKILAGLKSKAELDSIKIRREILVALGEELGVPGLYLFTFDQGSEEITAHTRMFSPGSGVEEDPVTGNAAGALALYLNRYTNRVPDLRASFMQGEAMGRQGLVHVQVNQLFATVLGQACTVFETHLYV